MALHDHSPAEAALLGGGAGATQATAAPPPGAAPPGGPQGPTDINDPRAGLTPEQMQIVAIAIGDPAVLSAIAAEIAGGVTFPGNSPAIIPPEAVLPEQPVGSSPPIQPTQQLFGGGQ